MLFHFGVRSQINGCSTHFLARKIRQLRRSVCTHLHLVSCSASSANFHCIFIIRKCPKTENVDKHFILLQCDKEMNRPCDIVYCWSTVTTEDTEQIECHRSSTVLLPTNYRYKTATMYHGIKHRSYFGSIQYGLFKNNTHLNLVSISHGACFYLVESLLLPLCHDNRHIQLGLFFSKQGSCQLILLQTQTHGCQYKACRNS